MLSSSQAHLVGRKLVQTQSAESPRDPPSPEIDFSSRVPPDVAKALQQSFRDEDNGEAAGADSQHVVIHSPNRQHPARVNERPEGVPARADSKREGVIAHTPDVGARNFAHNEDESQQPGASEVINVEGQRDLPQGMRLRADIAWFPNPPDELEARPPAGEQEAPAPVGNVPLVQPPPSRLAAAGRALAIGIPNMLRVLASEGLGVIAGAYAASYVMENDWDGVSPMAPIVLATGTLGAYGATRLTGTPPSCALPVIGVGVLTGAGIAQQVAAFEADNALGLDGGLSAAVFKSCLVNMVAIPIAESVYQVLDRFVPKGKLVVPAGAPGNAEGQERGRTPVSKLLATGTSSSAAHTVAGVGLYMAGGALSSTAYALGKHLGIPAQTLEMAALQAPQVLGRSLAALYEALIAAKAVHNQGFQLTLVGGALRDFCSSWTQMARMSSARLLLAASPHEFLTIGAAAADHNNSVGGGAVKLLRSITDQLAQFTGAAVEHGNRRDAKARRDIPGESTSVSEFLRTCDLFYGGSGSGWMAKPHQAQ